MNLHLLVIFVALCKPAHVLGRGLANDSSTNSAMNVCDSHHETLEKEVCVIGGGAAGSYSAYQLQKRGYDVVLFEPQSNLGGNCETVQVPSKLNPNKIFNASAAVVIFSPNKDVLDFFNDFNATFQTMIPVEQVKAYLYGIPGMPRIVIPAPRGGEFIQGIMTNALEAYFDLLKNMGLLGEEVIPDWENLSIIQREFLLLPFGVVAATNPLIAPLMPIMSALMQGFGHLPTLPTWEVIGYAGPVFIQQLMEGTFLELTDTCQSLYNKLEIRMRSVDPSSVQLDTVVQRIERGRGCVMLTTARQKEDDGTRSYKCNHAIVAFRPPISRALLPDMTRAEHAFLNDFGHGGYIASLWSMDPGYRLRSIGLDMNQEISFNNVTIVDEGIITINKQRADPDFPWRIFYQTPSKRIETAQELENIRLAMESVLLKIGFVNLQTLFITSHIYGVKPQTEANVLQWRNFFHHANYEDSDNLFWTGAAVAGEGSETVWKYSRELLDAKFPFNTAGGL
jgi:hypothetical protein